LVNLGATRCQRGSLVMVIFFLVDGEVVACEVGNAVLVVGALAISEGDWKEVGSGDDRY
jgi:hypothetical protein